MNFSKLARPYSWLTDHRLWREAVPQIAKQLPPSAAQLRLLDVGSGAGYTIRALQQLRPDIFSVALDPAMGMVQLGRQIAPGAYVVGSGFHLPFADNSFDSVIAQRVYYFIPHKDQFLQEILRVLRPGGRFVMINPAAGRSPLAAWREAKYGFRSALDMLLWHTAARLIGGLTIEGSAAALQAAGYARILAEPLVNGWAIMARGEKPHTAGASTFERIAVGAEPHPLPPSSYTVRGNILQGLEIENTPGKFIHLLIHQTPNKPAWAIQPGEVITWGAVAALMAGQPPIALAFTALPKAVQFMQAAVLSGAIKDVSKVAKFSKTTGAAWDFPIWLNPTLEEVQAYLPGTLIGIAPESAETPDE